MHQSRFIAILVCCMGVLSTMTHAQLARICDGSKTVLPEFVQSGGCLNGEIRDCACICTGNGDNVAGWCVNPTTGLCSIVKSYDSSTQQYFCPSIATNGPSTSTNSQSKPQDNSTFVKIMIVTLVSLLLVGVYGLWSGIKRGRRKQRMLDGLEEDSNKGMTHPDGDAMVQASSPRVVTSPRDLSNPKELALRKPQNEEVAIEIDKNSLNEAENEPSDELVISISPSAEPPMKSLRNVFSTFFNSIRNRSHSFDAQKAHQLPLASENAPSIGAVDANLIPSSRDNISTPNRWRMMQVGRGDKSAASVKHFRRHSASDIDNRKDLQLQRDIVVDKSLDNSSACQMNAHLSTNRQTSRWNELSFSRIIGQMHTSPHDNSVAVDQVKST